MDRFITGTPKDEEKEDYQVFVYGTHDEWEKVYESMPE
ncbi:hypothetical protein SOVF_004110 [Spinacia oleracea]|nr:hypothetical protein SOVF_004110 [Spinacia oleracea]